MQEHFARIETGKITDEVEIVTDYNSMPPLLQDYAPRELECFATKYETVSLMRKLQGGRASGPDGFSVDLMKTAPVEMTEVVFLLLTKREEILSKEMQEIYDQAR